ncbi:MAG: methylated-DNA--[protein]-cysteine S-methyltransferase [Geobacteraceae bacterium]|nr:methylated-DNA--[protein]-cysteine S-methyltransferase [Geobacteraceae bacterium]
MTEYVSLFETGLGMGAVVASEQGIRRVYLPHDNTLGTFARDGLDRMPASELTDMVAGMLMQYFKGERQQFDTTPVDISLAGQFRLHVLRLIRSIPYGVVRSYGEVARLAGSPGAARAVGAAMASNPVPIVIPCHRVVAANGRLTGYSAPGGLELKKYLLQMEGVEFKGELICQEK